MNARTSKLLRKYALGNDFAHRAIKRIWKNTPRNKKYSLRKNIKNGNI